MIDDDILKPPISWWISINKARVRESLEEHPEIKEKLGHFLKLFIKWAAKHRITYEEDVIDEYDCFVEEVINKRLSNINIDEWKRISKEVFERDNYTCQYCGKIGGKLEPDHIIPISKGGTSELNNLATTCQKCNRQKKDKTLDEFNNWKLSH